MSGGFFFALRRVRACPLLAEAVEELGFKPASAGGGLVFSRVLFRAFTHHSGGHGYGRRSWRRSGRAFDQALEVLNGGGEQALVTRARETAQSEPRHCHIPLRLPEQPLDLFAVTGRLIIAITAAG